MRIFISNSVRSNSVSAGGVDANSALSNVSRAKRIKLGFTLVEVLVVILVVSLAAAFAVANFRSDDRQVARDEARRLAALLTQARDEAITSGSSLAWRVDPAGYSFLRRGPDRTWQPFAADEAFRPYRLPSTMQFSAVEIAGRRLDREDVLVFSSTGIAPPFKIVIALNAERITVRSDTPARIVVERVE